MTTITTPRLSLTHFVTDDWPFFLRLRQDPQVMRFMGEVLSEEALRSAATMDPVAAGTGQPVVTVG